MVEVAPVDVEAIQAAEASVVHDNFGDRLTDFACQWMYQNG